MKAIPATYKNGKIKLSEKPPETGPVGVLVVFPDAADDPWEKILNEPKPRPAFAKYVKECLDEIKKGKAKPLNLDDL